MPPTTRQRPLEELEEGLAANVPDDWEDEDEDDDMDFFPVVEGTDEEDGDLFEDASESLGGFSVVTEDENGDEESSGEDNDGEETETEENEENEEIQVVAGGAGGGRQLYVTRDQILRIIGSRGLRRLFTSNAADVDEDSDEDPSVNAWGRARPRAARRRTEFEKVPSEAGRELMAAGIFGANERPADSIQRRKKLASRLLRRELGLGSVGRQRARSGLLKQDLIPSSNADTVINFDTRCYSGQFSGDGNFFFSCSQDMKVRMYDTSNPYNWRYYKEVDNPYGQWTITDASLSPDNKFLAYSSISRIVCLAPTDPADNSTPRVLDFSRTGQGSRGAWTGHRAAYHHFGIWSIRFSGDGREIVAGTGDNSVYVFDIERNMSILRIPGHENDVNAVCFGDTNSPHILYSGSDDTTLKVWDRRSMGDGRAAGVFLGHTEGLTYVDSKGDGRYIISNAKDQTAKLWDLRKVIPTEEADKVNPMHYSTGFDYRRDIYDVDDWSPHPHDCSLVTFRGHKVLKTLIRCHFSPPGSTDSRYVYSGSSDGKVYIWNLDATLKDVIDVGQATAFLRERDRSREDENMYWGQGGYSTCVRDASWHPDVPMIAATSWNGWGTATGTCSIHSWNDNVDEDELGTGIRVNERLQPEDSPNVTTRARRRARGW